MKNRINKLQQEEEALKKKIDINKQKRKEEEKIKEIKKREKMN